MIMISVILLNYNIYYKFNITVATPTTKACQTYQIPAIIISYNKRSTTISLLTNEKKSILFIKQFYKFVSRSFTLHVSLF